MPSGINSSFPTINKTSYYIHFLPPQTSLTFLMTFWGICLSPHRRGEPGIIGPQHTTSNHREGDTVNVIPTDALEKPRLMTVLEVRADLESSGFAFATSAWKPPTTHLSTLEPLLLIKRNP